MPSVKCSKRRLLSLVSFVKRVLAEDTERENR